MLYAIMATDVDGSLEKRKLHRTAHLKRLGELKVQGRLVIAGPHPAIDSDDPGPNGFTGSLIIAEFATLEAARRWADEDPFVKGGIYAHVVVKPFKQVLP